MSQTINPAQRPTIARWWARFGCHPVATTWDAHGKPKVPISAGWEGTADPPEAYTASPGFGIVPGPRLHIIDIDGKPDETGSKAADTDRLLREFAAAEPELFARLAAGFAERSTSDGLHIAYTVAGDVPVPPKVLARHPDTSAAVELLRAGMQFVPGRAVSLGDPAEVTPDEHQRIVAALQTLDRHQAAGTGDTGNGTAYTSRRDPAEFAACIEMLTGETLTAQGRRADGGTYWHRAGAADAKANSVTVWASRVHVGSPTLQRELGALLSPAGGCSVSRLWAAAHGGESLAGRDVAETGWPAELTPKLPPGAVLPGTSVATVTGQSAPAPSVVRLSDVEEEQISWLWDGHFPLGKVVTMDGDPGVGKSTVMLDIAARVTTGTAMPDGTAGRRGSVMVLSAEDGLADTIKPRLTVAGADCAKVITITEIAGRPVTLPFDIPVIEQVIADHGVILVIIDVLVAYLDGNVNSHRDQDVRRALAQVHAMAERTGCCVVVLRHLNKSGGSNATYRGGGSIGIIGAARAGFLCAYDPDDDSRSRRVLACVKINIAAMPPSLGYTLDNDEARGCAKVTWTGVSEHAAGELVTESDAEQKSETKEAGAWLADYLESCGGSAAAGDVIKAGKAAGFLQRTLQRARTKLGVTTGRDDFKPGSPWLWALPTKVPGAQPPDTLAPSAEKAPVSAGQTEDDTKMTRDTFVASSSPPAETPGKTAEDAKVPGDTGAGTFGNGAGPPATQGENGQRTYRPSKERWCGQCGAMTYVTALAFDPWTVGYAGDCGHTWSAVAPGGKS